MKKVSNRNPFSSFFGFSLVTLLLIFNTGLAQDSAAETEAAATTEEIVGGDLVKGKQLFNQNCAACHSLNRKMTGPALANVESRLAEEEGLDKDWLYKWIKNSPAMIAEGDAYAVKIYNEYNQAAMTAFPTLS
ncbi:MAG: cytochrome c, partial [Bacteroidia bacterium]|nr:cytochrome c [Bacteroidia bacterium]